MELRFDSLDMAHPVGNIAVFWKIAEEFQIMSCLSDSIEKEDATSFAVFPIHVLCPDPGQDHGCRLGCTVISPAHV